MGITRPPIVELMYYTDAVMGDFDTGKLKAGDEVLVRMRVIRRGDEGGWECVESSFNRDIKKEPEQVILINWVDIVGKEMEG